MFILYSCHIQKIIRLVSKKIRRNTNLGIIILGPCITFSFSFFTTQQIRKATEIVIQHFWFEMTWLLQQLYCIIPHMGYRETGHSRINICCCSFKICNSIHSIKNLWDQRGQILLHGINNINQWLLKNGLIIYSTT